MALDAGERDDKSILLARSFKVDVANDSPFVIPLGVVNGLADPSPQPIENMSRDTALSVNGEIYNHQELRQQLEKDLKERDTAHRVGKNVEWPQQEF